MAEGNVGARYDKNGLTQKKGFGFEREGGNDIRTLLQLNPIRRVQRLIERKDKQFNSIEEGARDLSS